MVRPNLLVIDDEVEIRETVTDLLEQSGYNVVGLANGQQALAYLRHAKSPPCLILLDLMMPVMSGEAFRKAQLCNPGLAAIPVILVSADPEVAAKARKLQVANFLKKPFEVEDLIATVGRYC